MIYAVLDVETTLLEDSVMPKTLFWGLFDGKTYRKFQTTDDLLFYLRQAREPLCMLHHTNFDVHLLLIAGAPVKIRSSYGNRLIECGLYHHKLQNSYCAFPLKLAKIFEAFGREKTSLDDLDKRNYEDCVWGLECILELDATFEKLTGVRPLVRRTIAGASFAAAQTEAGEMPIDLSHVEAYRGGRTECFDTRAYDHTMKWDINSSYPYSVIQCPEKDVLLDVAVNVNDYYAPFFLAEVSEYFLFPNGKFRTWIWQSNLERIASATRSKISIVNRYPTDMQWLCRLKDLVRRVFHLKSTSTNLAEVTCCKLFLNSMYGRMGLRGGRERCRYMDYMPMVRKDTTAYKFGEGWLVFDTMWGKPKANYRFASYITDAARTRLYEQFQSCSAYYGDTDSVFCAPEMRPVPIGKGLGEWTGEGPKSFKAENVKDYKWGDDEVLKGGKESLQWTLKQVVQGKPPARVTRERVLGMQKRVLLADGTTRPLTVDEIFKKFVDKPKKTQSSDTNQLTLKI